MFLRIIVSFLILNLSLSLYGQDTRLLILEKLGRKKRIMYQAGDEIILKLKNDKQEIRGEITAIFDNSIRMMDAYINLDEIKYIKTEHTNGILSPSNGPKLIFAGLGLILIDQVNHTLIRGQEFRLPSNLMYISGGLVVSGALWTSFRYRKFRPGENGRIRTFILQ